MKFVHEDSGFSSLLGITAAERQLGPALVEKDYWVTHVLWALQKQGWDIWFKGGTCLSKGFGLLERFSEDLDLKIEPGAVQGLEEVTRWKSDTTGAVAQRRKYFGDVSRKIKIPDAKAILAQEQDKLWRGANIEIRYPGLHLVDLGPLSPSILLEIGNARVTPHVPRDLDSFVHSRIRSVGQAGSFTDNRPKALRCVHPLVTLLEKMDAIVRRFPKTVEAAVFVRHYEDAARIILADGIPGLPDRVTPYALAEDLLARKQIAALPDSRNPAFHVTDGPRWKEIQTAWRDIGPIYWGPRISLEQACKNIRTWIQAQHWPL